MPIKIERLSLVEQVVTQMEQLIESGHWKIGDRLPAEMQLMKEFGVSRNTLREAVGGLVHAGLLETKQGSGTVVKSSSAFGVALHRQIEKSSVMETLEVRLALEREAAQLAATRRDELDIESLTKAIQLCRLASEKGDVQEFLQADILFHKAMVKASHNTMLERIYEHITEPLRSSIEEVMMAAEDFRYNGEVHHELLEAIKMQDVQAAISHVNTYINGFREKIELIQED
ncbi:FadR/GntR family transcriptional regulator [Sporosarcina gallistercoris]|uniref:FadR family transcriptional regulator n=1 Tax=Sporosarcina gallistercoris TaxID=2762245 RepID=A0ABR8PIP9_9BACL|nr:FadR/GntR family transcriptional regulator [Sporosarcina gallistercoris]MBD7908035.1 FadR family transcriptional regulator [Sporosarcina gallistercoris]